MNGKLIVVAVGALAIVGVLALLWYVTAIPKTVPVTPSTNGGTTTTTAISTSPLSTSGSSGIATVNTIKGQQGEIEVRNFLDDETTIPDAANAGRYLLAGNLGYCLTDPQECQAATTTNFSIFYNSGPQSFTIGLTDEPLGQARLQMEQFLMTSLGLSQSEMCNLNYLIAVREDVSPQFSGKNLGFSFCPGATVLPQ